ncbi:MAG TPA: 6-phosphofructokinase [Elusimicrobiota bacterium]|nr:6-phosphofructokinase [Elusimicrobiota bacterium]
MPEIKRIAVNTGGGDAPGLNAVIRAVVLSATRLGWEVLGIKRGYDGLLDPSQVRPLTEEDVRGITAMGGTILGTTNKGNPFEYPMKQPDGSVKAVDRSAEVVSNFKKLGLDALVAIGGDGSLRIAKRFNDLGVPVVGVPKTIDNDLQSTVVTFGFDTAVGIATDALDKLHSTAESHRRVMVVEVMGRYAGWIALNAGVSSTSDVILIPEIPFDIEKVCEKIRDREARGREFSIVVVAEGAVPKGGSMSTVGAKEVGREVRLGGICAAVAAEIEKRTGKETRSLVLGHLQRGGGPTTFDRLIALRFGAAAVRAIQEGQFGGMVALNPPTVTLVPLAEAVAKMKQVPLDCDTIKTARSLGVCLGD